MNTGFEHCSLNMEYYGTNLNQHPKLRGYRTNHIWMGVSYNGATLKSSSCFWIFHFKPTIFWVPPFMETPMSKYPPKCLCTSNTINCVFALALVHQLFMMDHDVDGCEILHQLVDGQNPLIVSLFTVFHRYHQLATGAGFLPSAVFLWPGNGIRTRLWICMVDNTLHF